MTVKPLKDIKFGLLKFLKFFFVKKLKNLKPISTSLVPMYSVTWQYRKRRLGLYLFGRVSLGQHFI